MSTLFFNTRYKPIKSFDDFVEAISYYNKDDRADKTLLNQSENINKDAKDMFDYYFYRKGSCGAFNFNGDQSYEDIIEEYKTYQPNYIWQNVISFTREDAIEFGLKTKKDFAALTRKVVIKVAQEKGIPLRDLAWSGFYHINTEHPHTHFFFYDRRNPFDNSLFSSKSITRIRSTIGHEVLDRAILLKSKEDASRRVILEMRKIINDQVFLKQLKDYRSQRTIETRKFINPKFQIKSEVFKQLQHLNNILPSSGRLSYNAHVMEPYKIEIDKMTDLLLNQKGLKDDYHVFYKQLEDIYQSNQILYGESQKQQDYVNNQIHRLYASLGNATLKMIKVYREYYYDHPDFKYDNYMSKKDLKKDSLKLIKPYAYDLIRYSFKKLAHEISVTKQLQRVRYRNEKYMLREIEKEEKENEKEEKEVEYAEYTS